MAQFLDEVVFFQRRNKRHAIGILEGGEKVELTGRVCDSFFADSIIGGIGGVDKKENWTFKYVQKRLETQYPNNGVYIKIHGVNIVPKNKSDQSLYVTYDIYTKSI